jgi:hypothetical protein
MHNKEMGDFPDHNLLKTQKSPVSTGLFYSPYNKLIIIELYSIC